jgi:hypothetical protein
VSRNIAITGFGSILLLFTTLSSAQQTQTNQPAQPTSSVYNRMRRLPPQGAGTQNQQQTSQTQQFPSPGQQFPPEQQGAPGQAPPIRLPGSVSPAQPQASPQQNVPTGSPASAPVQTPQSAATQTQGPYGLALQPANPPRISYANGELTVVADNSSMTDIMSGIERATGARLEGSQPDTERVFGQFGPASPRDVLDSLLSGSRYDFILVGAIDDPGGVKTIMLSPHGSSAAGGSVAQNQPVQPRSNATDNPDDDNDEAVAAQQSMSEAPQPVQNVKQPAQYPPSEQTTPPQNGQQQQQQQVKTPEQLLQELQRLRQQQQQQQPPQEPQNPR